MGVKTDPFSFLSSSKRMVESETGLEVEDRLRIGFYSYPGYGCIRCIPSERNCSFGHWTAS